MMVLLVSIWWYCALCVALWHNNYINNIHVHMIWLSVCCRFKALLGMLHVSDPSQINQDDRLTKIRPLIDHMKMKCKELYQPAAELSVDERMVKSKGRSGIRQFVPNKPTRFGFKLWCLCEAKTGFTLNFEWVQLAQRKNWNYYLVIHRQELDWKKQ